MPLRIYIRRHSPECLKRIHERIANEEIDELSPEQLREYKYCHCGWWMYGTSDSGVPYKPHALKVYSFGAADKKRIAANKPATEEKDTSITLRKLTEEFLKDRENKGRTDGTTGIYKRVGKRLVEYVEKQNPKVVLASKVTGDHILHWRTELLASGKIKTLGTANYHVGVLGMIFGYGVKKKKITTNPVDGIQPLERKKERGADADDEEQEGDEHGRTLPLDPEGGDKNYQKLLAGVVPFMAGTLIVPGRKFAREKQVPVLTDTDRFILLMELMYETGLRVSDAIHCKPSKLVIEDGKCCSYTTKQIKTGDPVTVFMPRDHAERLQKLTPLHKSYVFFDGCMPWRRFISDVVWRMISDLGEAVGVPNARPHRFRDSFAVNRLNEGMLMENLSILLGHRRVETTRKYYNPWVKSRHDSLRKVYLDAKKNGEFIWQQQQAVIPITAANEKRRA